MFSGFKLRVGEIVRMNEERQRAIARTIEEDMKHAYQIATEIPWMPRGQVVPFDKLPVLDRRLALMQIFARLKLMVTEGKAKRLVKESVDYYFAGG